MQRIVYIIDSLGCTGVTRQMLLVAGGVAAHGFDVHVAVLEPPRRHRFSLNGAASSIRITHLGRRLPLDPIADWRLLQHVARLQPSIVHTWDSAAGVFGPLALRAWYRWSSNYSQPIRSPRADAARSGMPRLIVGTYRARGWAAAWPSIWQARFASGAEYRVTNSAAVRDACQISGSPNNEIRVIAPGMPPARPSDVSRSQLLSELQLPANAKLIGVLGRLIPEQRVQDLIWAADLLRVLHDNLRLLIIGDGPLRAPLERYARMASDLDHIRFLGQRDDVWRILPHLDVLWHGSEGRGISIAVLEAMSAGVPVIASDVAVNREILVDGETGYLIPIGHRSGRADRARHTSRIFGNSELAARLGRAAQQHVAARFSLDQLIRRHVELYAEALTPTLRNLLA